LTHYYSDGQSTNLPWLLIAQENDVVKEVILKIKFLIGFASNINNILTKKVILVGKKLMIGIPLLRFDIF
jgi:hypothetical protein